MLGAFGKKLVKIWKIKALRDRIFFTLAMFIVIRVGSNIPLPGIDLYKLKLMNRSGFFDFVNMISGGAFARASIFTLSIAPYISSSIIVYILTLAYPKLEEMNREGGKEKAKLTQWTRYLAVLVSVVQSIFAVIFLESRGLVERSGFSFTVSTILILTASVTFLTWVGDQITTHGIGNGISLIIFIGIVSRIPSSVIQLFIGKPNFNTIVLELIGISLIGLSLIGAIVAFQIAVRNIPVFYASGKGRSVANKSNLPIRINNAGVMPIIFSSVVATLPSTIISFLPDTFSWKIFLTNIFDRSHWVFQFFYFILVLFFTFFYTAVIFDSEKIADNLKRGGASIAGVRPGRESAEYLEGIITKITFGGALFLAILAILPFALTKLLGGSFNIGGTGIIIAVGVAIETIQYINGALSMEDYDSFI